MRIFYAQAPRPAGARSDPSIDHARQPGKAPQPGRAGQTGQTGPRIIGTSRQARRADSEIKRPHWLHNTVTVLVYIIFNLTIWFQQSCMFIVIWK
jgi:hypothetical protein